MRSLTILIIMAGPLLSASAQVYPNADNINKSVVFIYPAAADGSPDESRPLGTGFFIQVPFKSRPERAIYVLATARHVVQPGWAFCPPHVNPAVAYIRVNKRDFVEGRGERAVEFLRIDLSRFVTGPEDVDVAVTPIGIPDVSAKYDVNGVPIYYFATAEEMQALSFGDAVVTAGLLPAFPGSTRNYPFFKFGHISAMPTEPVQAPCAPNEPARLIRLIFVAMNLVPGNSGSPTFYTPPPFSRREPRFVGVQSMSFPTADVGGMTSANEVYAVVEKLKLPEADLRRGRIPQQQPASTAKKSESPK